jgi:hypothetical protein
MTLALNHRISPFMVSELRAVRNSPHQRHRRARMHRETPQAHANSIADVLSDAAENGEAEPAAALNLAACLKDAQTDGLPARISTRGDAVTVKAGRATRRLELTEAQTQIVQRVIMLASDRERAA